VLKAHTRTEFRTKNPAAYGAAVKKNVLDQVCGHMVRLIKHAGYWTKNRIVEEAKQFNSRSEFKRKASTAYHKARKKGWLEEACSHMQVKQKPRGYWTIDNIKKEAQRYKTRTEFMKGSVSAYSIAAKNKWLDEACMHMGSQLKLKRSE
jgi:DNA primase